MKYFCKVFVKFLSIFYNFFSNPFVKFLSNLCKLLPNFCQINRLNSFCLENERMGFRPNIKPIQVIEKGAF